MNHHSFELGKKQTQKDRDHKAHNTRRCILIVLSISMLVFVLIPFTAVRIVSAQPGVQTTATTNITDSSAQLNGLVTPNGMETQWAFLYYRVKDNAFLGYCPETPGVLLGPGQAVTSNTIPVSCQLTDLQPSTTYSSLLSARWTGGAWQFGTGLAFTTSVQMYTINTIMTIASITKSSGTTASSTTSQPMGPGFDFALLVSPSAVSVQQGGTAHYAVSVTYSDPSYAGTLINLQLTGLGPGMGWGVTPAGDLAISTVASTPPGTYPLSLTGSANGVAHQTGVTLIVTSAQAATTAVTTTTALTTTSSQATTATSSAPFDYSITVSPSTQSAQKGGSVSYVVSVLPLSGSPVPVSLTLMGCPGDVRTGFTVQSGNPPYTSTLNLDLSSTSANAGAYTLTILASAGSNVKTATATLMIQEKPAQTIVAPTTATSGTNWSDFLSSQQNLMLLLLLLLVVVLGVLGFRFGRRGRRVPSTISAPGGFCGSCGAVMGEGAQFCPKCGAKRPGS